MGHIKSSYKILHMKEFLLIFRMDYSKRSNDAQQLQQMMQKWMDWLGSIAAEDKLVTKGNRLQNSGRIVKNNLVTNGPYTEIKEAIGGYSIIKAESYDEAVEKSKGCPVLILDGSVEVREIDAM